MWGIDSEDKYIISPPPPPPPPFTYAVLLALGLVFVGSFSFSFKQSDICYLPFAISFRKLFILF